MVKIMGHRGARELWTENTIQGFRNAVALGVDMVEFDVHLSADDVPVVMHDPLLDRTCHGTGPIRDLSAEELCRVKLRDSDETIATLDEVLDSFAGTAVELAIEIKTGVDAAPYEGIEQRVLECVHKRGYIGRTRILSFVPECLRRMRALDADIGLMACVWRPQAELQGGLVNALDGVVSIPGAVAAVQEELFFRNETLCFERVPAERLAVGINNDPERLRHWFNRPVRHVSTDRPDVALSLRDG